MLIKYIVDEDFVNYKKCSMFIGFPHCTFKCNRDCGKIVCQNYLLDKDKNISMHTEEIVKRYINNNISESIVIGGLEPFDDFGDLLLLVDMFRQKTQDDIVIYTGYNEDEVEDKIEQLKKYNNIIVKFGRFVPDSMPRYEDLLGVTLASNNQYAKQIS